MKLTFRLSLVIVIALFFNSCAKEGKPGLNSLIDIENVASGSICPAGGLLVKYGLDDNRNNILDASEVDSSRAVCNGQNGGSSADKLIIIPLHGGTYQNTTTPYIFDTELVHFSKSNYPGVDSIVLASQLFVQDSTNRAIVSLYDYNRKVEIGNSTISSNKLFPLEGEPLPYSESKNIYNNIPDGDVTFGYKFQSQKDGYYAYLYNSYLLLYRK